MINLPMCSICLDNDNTILSCLCKNSICKECFVNGVEHSINNNTKFKCNCGNEYADEIVFQAIDENLSTKYQQYLLEKQIKNV